jgi:hypothetical protein
MTRIHLTILLLLHLKFVFSSNKNKIFIRQKLIIIFSHLTYLEEVLFAEEFTAYTFTTSSINSWSFSNRVYNCPSYTFIDYSGRSFYGMFGKSEIAEKTFVSLPPHWSLSVRFDILLFSSFDPSPFDYVRVKLDSSLINDYVKGISDGY